MKACVDGVVYQFQRRGGISRMHNEILPRMCELDPCLRIGIYLSGPSRQTLPSHPRISHYPPDAIYRLLGDGRLGRRLTRRLATASTWLTKRAAEGAIWHSTYYTRPPRPARAEVVTVVDMIHERFVDVFSGTEHDLIRARKQNCIVNANAIICISESTRDDLLTFYPSVAGNIHVVPLAHSDVFRLVNGLGGTSESRRPFLLYVGDRRGEHKNVKGLLEAFAAWAPHYDIELVLAGSALDEEEQRDLERRQLTGRVRVVVDPDDAGLARLYHEARMLVYPSLYEGFGLPLLEAMACGCPIVASRIPSTREIAGECATYFDPRDPRSLVAALDVGLNARVDSAQVHAGLERARGYSWDKAAAGTLAVYKSLGRDSC